MTFWPRLWKNKNYYLWVCQNTRCLCACAQADPSLHLTHAFTLIASAHYSMSHLERCARHTHPSCYHRTDPCITIRPGCSKTYPLPLLSNCSTRPRNMSHQHILVVHYHESCHFATHPSTTNHLARLTSPIHGETCLLCAISPGRSLLQIAYKVVSHQLALGRRRLKVWKSRHRGLLSRRFLSLACSLRTSFVVYSCQIHHYCTSAFEVDSL